MATSICTSFQQKEKTCISHFHCLPTKTYCPKSTAPADARPARGSWASFFIPPAWYDEREHFSSKLSVFYTQKASLSIYHLQYLYAGQRAMPSRVIDVAVWRHSLSRWTGCARARAFIALRYKLRSRTYDAVAALKPNTKRTTSHYVEGDWNSFSFVAIWSFSTVYIFGPKSLFVFRFVVFPTRRFQSNENILFVTLPRLNSLRDSSHIGCDFA